MNIYRVSQELKQEFKQIKIKDRQLESLQHFQKEMVGNADDKSKPKQLDLDELFSPFENLVEKDNRKIFAKKLKPQKDLIEEEDEDEEEEEDENEKRVKKVMSRKESMNRLKKETIKEEDEDEENYSKTSSKIGEKDQENLEDFLAQEKAKMGKTVGKSQDSFNVNNSLSETTLIPKDYLKPKNSLIHKIYENQMEKVQGGQIGLSFGPSPNFALQNKTMSFINESKNSGNNTKSRIFDSKNII